MDCEEAIALLESHPELMDSICEHISESAWSGDTSCDIPEGEDGSVYIADIQNINAINQVIVGSFWISGAEYAFEAESGNNNGWFWRSVSSKGEIPEINIHRPVYALQPSREIVSKAIKSNNQQFLVMKWDAFLTREKYKELPSKYAYDMHFSPTDKIRKYWKDKAAEVGFDIVTEDEANETRAMLMESQATQDCS